MNKYIVLNNRFIYYNTKKNILLFKIKLNDIKNIKKIIILVNILL